MTSSQGRSFKAASGRPLSLSLNQVHARQLAVNTASAPTLPRMESKGHEYTQVSCRGCGRSVKVVGAGNALVGCHDRMKCKACGHRGADLLRVSASAPRRRLAATVPSKSLRAR